MLTTLIVTAMLAADGVHLNFVPSGAMEKTGGYSPIRAEFTPTVPGTVKKTPEGLKNPLYGVMPFGDQKVGFIIDDSDPSRIFVDSNNDGDYTNDAAATWSPNKRGNFTMFTGSAKADIGRGVPVTINFYRFDPNDPQRAALKHTLLYYGDFGYDVVLTLGGKDYKSFVSGEPTANARLWVDRDGNGKQSFFHEIVQVGKPFNFTGTTYVLNFKDGQLSLDRAPAMAMDAMPPKLDVGAKVLSFTAKTMDGKTVQFPSSYKGKVVMLDFWATWCGPCMAEVPNVVKAYNQYKDKGFDILGVSFDQENAVEKIKSVTGDKGMAWPQIYEGKFWDTSLGHQFDVAAIPFALLVDGDTGEILATGNEIRGEGLAKSIEKALANKKAR